MCGSLIDRGLDPNVGHMAVIDGATGVSPCRRFQTDLVCLQDGELRGRQGGVDGHGSASGRIESQRGPEFGGGAGGDTDVASARTANCAPTKFSHNEPDRKLSFGG